MKESFSLPSSGTEAEDDLKEFNCNSREMASTHQDFFFFFEKLNSFFFFRLFSGFWICIALFFETGTYYVSKAGFELTV